MNTPTPIARRTSYAAIRHPKKRAFLQAYAKCGNITTAANIVGIERHTHSVWAKSDPTYKEAAERAYDEAGDYLEQEAWRRAVQGTERPIYQGKELVGTVREYSDVLLIFLLKAARPQKFRERYEHTGPGGGPIRIEAAHDELLSRLARIASRIGTPGGDRQIEGAGSGGASLQVEVLGAPEADAAGGSMALLAGPNGTGMGKDKDRG